MSSPFPGMDPWLESPSVWPDFHDRIAEQISSALNRELPEPYYAQLGVREQLEVAIDAAPRRIVPDVSIQAAEPQQAAPQTSSTAVLTGPRTDLTESVELDLTFEPVEVNFVEIRDPRFGHEVVTLIEILSPTNKTPGRDYDSYVRKRDEILSSTASLVEIDLLRSGSRDLYGVEVLERLHAFDPPPEYLALVQRAWKRTAGLHYQLFPAGLQQPLPVIAIPLRESDAEVTLDLQYAFQETYARGPYARGAVDYSRPAFPPLDGALMDWAAELLSRRRS